MRVLVAMSGGVDSSVAAALLRDEGHEIAGATLRLWGGSGDSGCCSVADVDDARRVAQQLGIDHYVFNFSDEFEHHVVSPYVEAHRNGRTPNPCVECNRHVKFDLFAARARRLGFEAIATGHHVRRVALGGGGWALARAADAAKDQSYVVHMIGAEVLRDCRFPIGDVTKAEVRRVARSLGLRTADKPESQDVCFITKSHGGRRTFLGDRIALRPARIVDTAGREVGATDAMELVTVGQRKGLGQLGAPEPRYVRGVDVAASTVTVGTADELLTDVVRLEQVVLSVPFAAWSEVVDAATGRAPVTSTQMTSTQMHSAQMISAQMSAHGDPVGVEVVSPDVDAMVLRFASPRRRVAPGQTVVIYAGDVVVAGGIATA